MIHWSSNERPPELLQSDLVRLLKGEYQSHYPRWQHEQSVDEIIQECHAQFQPELRQTLYHILSQQHRTLELSDLQKNHLESIKSESTFTVCTGQQIHPFLGPAFVWAKVATVIHNAQKLSHKTQKNIIPVFWMASEDHDFEEIREVKFLGKTYVWEVEPTGGPVGLLDTTGIVNLLQDMKRDFAHDQKVCDYLQRFDGIYGPGITLVQASRILLHQYFGEYGLLLIDPLDKDFKALVSDVFLKEVDGTSFNAFLETQNALKNSGFKIPINPRKTALFYYFQGKRLRIDQEGESTFKTSNNEVRWAQHELQIEIQECPHRFSPNALLRPAYQQRILPNIMYVGGPSECLYWLQVPQNILENSATVPLLDLRMMCNLIPKNAQSKIASFPWGIQDWYRSEEFLGRKLWEFEYGNLSLPKHIELLKIQFEGIWESLYQLKHPELKKIKKEHEEVLKKMRSLEKQLIDEGLEGYLAPKMKQLKQLKATIFNTVAPPERTQFWIEWEFKMGAIEVFSCPDTPFVHLEY